VINFAYAQITHLRFAVIGGCDYIPIRPGRAGGPLVTEHYSRRNAMKTWMKPSVREQEVGLEVTSYLPAEIDLI
jgi:coenzyme PQQ precursor peptide PqqA